MLRVPYPKVPYLLIPQHQTVPSAFNTATPAFPATIFLTSVTPVACTGNFLVVFAPFPNCPKVPAPQLQTVPSFANAATKACPTLTCLMSFK